MGGQIDRKQEGGGSSCVAAGWYTWQGFPEAVLTVSFQGEPCDELSYTGGLTEAQTQHFAEATGPTAEAQTWSLSLCPGSPS